MKILICIASMPHAEPAVWFGGVITRITKASVTLLHVIRRQEDRKAGERILALADEMLPDLKAETRIRRGDPTGRILAEIREGDYDLLVIGARQGVALTQRLLGSVAQQVIRRAPICVLVVPGLAARPDLKRVLISTGGIEVAEPVIETGARLAGAAHAQATLLYVASPIPSMYTGLDEIEETLSELLNTDTPVARHLRHGAAILAQHHVAAELELRHGIAADEILREASKGDYDLIVIGASGTAGRLRGWLLGDVTREVVNRALRPVLVVRGRLAGLTE